MYGIHSSIFFNFTDDKALRKHFLCLKIQSSKTATSAVCDIVLINRTKGEQTPPGYHLIV